MIDKCMTLTEAKFYKTLAGGLIQCNLCNHYCAIKDGRVGTCGARKNLKGRLYSLVYGYPVALNIDPVEKKPLFHFQPGSNAYSLGTFGCNLACANCQNWDISQEKKIEAKNKKLNLVEPAKIVAEALSDGCASIAYTYNEPTIFYEYALDIMKLARENGLKNIWVTNGFISKEALSGLLPYLDAANVDLKSVDADFYRDNCGGDIAPIIKNLKFLKKEQVHLEITTLIIPSLSDDQEMLIRLANFIMAELGEETPWHISRFSPEISWKLKALPSTEAGLIYSAYNIGRQAGLKYVYVGNLPGDQKENTYCPFCGELAIRRLGYDLERYDNAGLCPNCDKNLDIID